MGINFDHVTETKYFTLVGVICFSYSGNAIQLQLLPFKSYMVIVNLSLTKEFISKSIIK